MFRHPSSAPPAAAAPGAAPTVGEKVGIEPPAAPGAADTSPKALKELIEKNLKWSQIIYEQNRKINSKLFWAAAAQWLLVVILLAPLIAAIIFLPPLWRSFKVRYGDWLKLMTPSPRQIGRAQPSGAVENLFNFLSLTPAQKEQLRAILK